MTTFSDVFAIPAPELEDGPANIENAVVPMRDRMEALMLQVFAGLIPVGASIAWDGASDPPAGADGVQRFMLRDGRLINRTTYASYFALIGHSANGGVDPGSNLFRIPDRRGRVSVGPDAMGVQGAASRIPNSPRTLMAAGGEERHVLTSAEVPSLLVPTGSTGVATANATGNALAPSGGGAVNLVAVGGGGAHNLLQPYLVENQIVRVI